MAFPARLSLISFAGNDTTWLSDTIAHMTHATGGTISWEPQHVSAQYLKVYCVKRATVYGNSLFEIRACGNQANGDGIRDETKLNRIVVFPNPAADVITVSLPDAEPGVISIFNLQGKLVQSEPGVGKNISVNIRALGRGVYYIRTETRSGILTGKFIKF